MRLAGPGLLPGFASLRELFVRQLHVEPLRIAVERDEVAFLEQRDRTALPGLGRHMAGDHAVRTAGEAPVREEADAVAEALPRQRGRDREHLRHSRRTRRPDAADHHDVALANLSRLDRLEAILLRLEDSGRPGDRPLLKFARQALVMTSTVQFTENEPYEKGFAEVFDQQIAPELEDLERERLALYRKRQRRLTITIVVTAVFALVALAREGCSVGGVQYRAEGLSVALAPVPSARACTERAEVRVRYYSRSSSPRTSHTAREG